MPARHLTGELRTMLRAASALVFLAGIPLFLGSEQTDQYFAWTIMPPLTAAFLGAAYWSSLVLLFFSAREALWARARLAVTSILLVSTLMLVATLLHLDRFHLSSPVLVAQGVAWAWLVIYVAVPTLMLVFGARQLRAPGEDPAPTAPLPVPLRLTLAVQAGVMLAAGAALFIAPSVAGTIWPWTLTPLTARAVGAWLVGLGAAAAQGIWENDLGRAHAAFIASAVLGGLELLALARYSGSLRWGDPAAWAYVLLVLIILGVGLYGVVADASARRRPRDQRLAVNP